MIITIEGADRSGKSTQTAMLRRWLQTSGYATRLFEFPDYSTPVGRRIQECLRSKVDPKTIHLMMAENRQERLDDIRRAMDERHMLVMNRYCESNIIYGMANGLDRTWLEQLDAHMPKSDIVILLDVDVNELDHRRKGADCFESDRALMKRVVEGYRHEADRYRWQVVDGTADMETVHNMVVSGIEDTL